MHTSVYLDDRSPTGGDDLSSNTGQYFHGTRGFGSKRRGSFNRGRGGPSYHRSSGNWQGRANVKEEPQGDAHALSLLSRLEPSTDSLLNRLSPPKDSPTASGSGGVLGLVNRLADGGDGVYSRGDSEAEPTVGEVNSVPSSRNSSAKPTSMNDLLLAEEIIASALAQGMQVIEKKSRDAWTSKSPTSEAAVDDLLATEDEEFTGSTASIRTKPPKDVSSSVVGTSPTTTPVRSQSVDRASVVEQARKLFIPVIIQNARLRNPDMDPEELEKKVVSLVTDEQCLEFVKFAADARNQLKDKDVEGRKEAPSMLDLAGMMLGSHSSLGTGKGGTKVESVHPTGECAKVADDAKEVSIKNSDDLEKDAVHEQRSENLSDPGMKRRREPTVDAAGSTRPVKIVRRSTYHANTQDPNPEVVQPTVSRSASDDTARSPLSVSLAKSMEEPPELEQNNSSSTRSSGPSDRRGSSSPPSPPALNNLTQGKTVQTTHPSVAEQCPSPDTGHRVGTTAAMPMTMLEAAPAIDRLLSYASSDMDIDTDTSPSPAKRSPDFRHLDRQTAPPLDNQTDHRSYTRDTSVPPKERSTPTLSDPTGGDTDAMMDVEHPTTTSLARRPIEVEDCSVSTVGTSFSTRPDDVINDQTTKVQGPDNDGNGDSARDVQRLHATNAEPAIGAWGSSSATPIPRSDTPTQEKSKKPFLLTSSQTEKDRTARISSPAPVQLRKPKEITSNAREMAADPVERNGLQRPLTSITLVGDQSLADGITPQGPPSNSQEGNVPTGISPSQPSTVQRNSEETPQGSETIDVESPPRNDAPPLAKSRPTQPDSMNSDPSPSSHLDRPIDRPTNVSAAASTDVRIRGEAEQPPSAIGSIPRKPSPAHMDSPRPPATAEAAVPSGLPLPSLCFAEVGKPRSQVFDVSYSVDEETASAARRWSLRQEIFDPSVSYAAFHLLCLQVADIEEVVQQNPGASPEEFASVLWQTQTKWPRPGQLLVEVNGETDSKGIWVPKHLGPKDGPIDLSAHIIPGANKIRLIQLAGQADRMFILYVGLPPEDELKRYTMSYAWDRFERTVQPPHPTMTTT